MSEKAPANLVERLRALHVWPQMVADTYADVLPPRHAKGLYEVGDVAHQAADALSAKDAEIARLRDALETIALNCHGSNPSLAYADAPREDYLAHVLWEARQLAKEALKGEQP